MLDQDFGAGLTRTDKSDVSPDILSEIVDVTPFRVAPGPDDRKRRHLLNRGAFLRDQHALLAALGARIPLVLIGRHLPDVAGLDTPMGSPRPVTAA